MLFNLRDTIILIKENLSDQKKVNDMTQRNKEIEQNLIDAGCTSSVIEKFFSYMEKNEKEKQIILLEEQRRKLLDDVHDGEKKIFCLDYLMYQMQKQS